MNEELFAKYGIVGVRRGNEFKYETPVGGIVCVDGFFYRCVEQKDEDENSCEECDAWKSELGCLLGRRSECCGVERRDSKNVVLKKFDRDELKKNDAGKNPSDDVLDATRSTFDEIRELVVAKSQNYGVGTVFQPPRLVPNATAETGFLTRLSDKFCRLETLAKGEPDKVGESFDDTLKDVVGYCVLLLTLRKSTQNKGGGK